MTLFVYLGRISASMTSYFFYSIFYGLDEISLGLFSFLKQYTLILLFSCEALTQFLYLLVVPEAKKKTRFSRLPLKI